MNQIISLKVIDTSPETINLSTTWRKNNLQWFHTEFTPTEEKSQKWITKILDDPQRILFMIFLDGKRIGQTGLDTFVESENSIEVTGTIKDKSIKFEYVGLTEGNTRDSHHHHVTKKKEALK